MSFNYKNPISPISVLGNESVSRTDVFGTDFSVLGTGGYMEVYSLNDLIFSVPTGTLIVPSPSNVRKGVPTDNTVGTADLTAADFWDYLSVSATTVGSMGEIINRIPLNPASVQSTGAQIASFNT